MMNQDDLINLNKADVIHFSDDLEFSSFETLKEFCEGLEQLGYRLNISENCYERAA